MLVFIGMAMCVSGLVLSYFTSMDWLALTLVGCVVLSARIEHNAVIDTIKYKYHR